MVEIWQQYVQNVVFVTLHIGVAFISLVVIMLWLKEIRQIRLAARVPPVSESDVVRLMAPIQIYSGWFDYCSSAFIFVGLIGTMNGFIKGVAQLRSPSYDFRDVQLALGTSAMGIVWAWTLTGIELLLEFTVLRETTSYVRRRVKGDALEVSVRDSLLRIQNALTAVLTEFAQSTEGIVTAIGGWKERIDALATEYQGIAADICILARDFKQTYAALSALPESIRKNLEVVFADSRESFAKTLDTIKQALKRFEAVPQALERAIDDSFAARRKVLEEILTKYCQQLDSQRSGLLEVFARTDSLPTRVGDVLVAETSKWITLADQSHQRYLSGISSAVRTAVEDQIAILAESKSKLDAKWDAVLAQERLHLRDAIARTLEESLRIVEHQREQLLNLESTLPEGLAKTFVELIDRLQQSVQLQQQAIRHHIDTAQKLDQTYDALVRKASEWIEATPGQGVVSGAVDAQIRPRPELSEDWAPLAHPAPISPRQPDIPYGQPNDGSATEAASIPVLGTEHTISNVGPDGQSGEASTSPDLAYEIRRTFSRETVNVSGQATTRAPLPYPSAPVLADIDDEKVSARQKSWGGIFQKLRNIIPARKRK